MGILAEPEFWGRLVSTLLIDLSLARDHALVIALAVGMTVLGWRLARTGRPHRGAVAGP
jgi:predicted tellurium resistance membrane protein TerC